MQFSHLTPVPLSTRLFLPFISALLLHFIAVLWFRRKKERRRGRRIRDRKEERGGEKRERRKKEGISKELSSRPVIRADATLIILLFDGIRARGDFVVANRRGQSGLVAASNEKVASVPVKIARLAMNTQIEFFPRIFTFTISLIRTCSKNSPVRCMRPQESITISHEELK